MFCHMFWVLGFEGESSSIFHHFLKQDGQLQSLKDFFSGILGSSQKLEKKKLCSCQKSSSVFSLWNKTSCNLKNAALFFVDEFLSPPSKTNHSNKSMRCDHVTLHQDFDNIDPHVKMGLAWSKSSSMFL